MSCGESSVAYADDLVMIYEGDCRTIVPQVEADVLITDPPYGTALYPTDTDVLTGELLAEWRARFRTIAVFGWPEKLTGLCVAADLVPDEWIVWWPTNARMRGFNMRGLWREIECVAVFGDGNWDVLRQPKAVTTTPMPDRDKRIQPSTREDVRMGDVWRDESPNLNPNQRGRRHPNEKPEAFMRRLLTALPEGVVLDPFCGSGTTLDAARSLGRASIGIELDPEHVATAINRLGQGRMAA